MKRAIVALALASLAILAPAGAPLAAELGLITGSEKGTYYQFGLNLQQLVKPRDIAVSVYPSKGSVENIFAVYKRPKTAMGIVQADVLAFVARVQTDPTLKRIARKIKMVFPLYNEEASQISTSWRTSGWPSVAKAAGPTSPPSFCSRSPRCSRRRWC
jgi:TRAP-type uncharacterized transport system substrate-binding protein